MTNPTDWKSRIGRRVRLRDLHALSAVIQSGSMAKAAKELGVTQSAVSQMIADLEAALRVRLLDRSPRGVVATIYGDILLKRSRAALDEIKHGIEEIEFLTDHATGQVRVGCPESISSAVLPSIADLFLQRFPRATLDVDDVNFGALSPLLERHIDLVVARGGRGFSDQVISDDLEVKTLFEDELVIAAGPKSRWFNRRKVDLADLVNERWILTAPGILESHAGVGSVSGARPRRSGYSYEDAVGPPSYQSDCDRRLHHHVAAVGPASLCRSLGPEGLAGRLPGPPMAGVHYHAEESHLEPARGKIHRMRVRDCKSDFRATGSTTKTR